MESHVTDLLSQVMKRLDQVQDQQSHTQTLLDEKLSEMAVRLEQEKIFMRDQLREAQNEILRRLRDIQGLWEGAVNVIPTSVSDTDRNLHQMTQSTVDLSDVINEARDKLQILDDRTSLMRTQITDTEQTCYNLTKWSRKIETLLENKITELVDHEKENLKSIPEMVRGQMRAELVWSDNLINERLTDLDTIVSLKLEQLIGQISEVTEQSGEVMDILIKQHEQVTTILVKQREQITNTLVIHQGEMSEKLFKLQEKLTDMLDKQNLAAPNLWTKDSIMKLEEYFNNSRTDVTRLYDTIRILEGHLTSVPDILKTEYKTNTDTLKTEYKTSTDTLKTEYKTCTDTLKTEYKTCTDTLKTAYKTCNDTLKAEYKTCTDTLKSEYKTCTDTLKTEYKACTDTLKTELETCTEKITKATDTTKEDLLKHLTNSEAVQSESLSKCTGEIKTLITSLTENVDTVKENMTVGVKKIENMETSLNDGHENVNNKLNTLKQQQGQARTEIELTKNNITDYICKTKHEIFAVTEKEAQIVRDRIEGPLPSYGKYTFDFYVENFKDLVRSEKEVYSPPWHINEMTSCVMGNALFLKNGEMEVWLMYGRRPREVGLQPKSGTTLKVKASICDISNKTLPTIDLGEKIEDVDESYISSNEDWGYKFGVTSCDNLIQKGYGMKEGYKNHAVLIRFDVTVL